MRKIYNKIYDIQELMLIGYTDEEILNHFLFKGETGIHELIHISRMSKELFEAISNGNEKRATELFSAYPVIQEMRDKAGFSPLLYAMKKGERIIARSFIENKGDVSTKANGGQTCLMWAFYHGDIELIDLLIEYGLDLNEYDTTFDNESILSICLHHWIKDQYAQSILNCLMKHHHLLTPELKKELEKSRLRILLRLK